MDTPRNCNRILLAVDDSEASERAVGYVGALLCGGDAVILLVNVLPPLPPATMETPGSLDPSEGALMGKEGRRAQREWKAERAREAQPTLDRMREMLLDSGIGEGRIELDYYAPTPEETVSTALDRLAADYECDTIVVGHRSLPWFRELFRRHIGEQLVRHPKGRTICVVE